MFNIVKKDNGICTIYRSGYIDAARCILKGNDHDITVVAEAEIKAMFSDMIDTFAEGASVRMLFLKTRVSDYIDFKSICQFKVWLVGNQKSDTDMLILKMLKDYCKKRKISLPNISIAFGDVYESAIFNTDMYFNNTYDKKWLNDDLIKRIVKDIDKSDVINSEAIKSPVFGIMPVEKLSGGVKTLMLIYNNPEMIFNASTCGDNCAKWIKKFSEEKDFVINLYHAMKFPGAKFEAYIVNGDEIITSMEELYICVDKYCRS
jgi:hypothetical protein